ncbi:DUF397 domain-containing protein [Streptomyces paludis]|uniref:DUF397 domain-containing protein n=1 Tax=Streptomyces paludis TaxID=2282738 RepID=A0A345HTG8_9ACTN|nr:DUF397 domain-containing protein [Streptomyces paludis]AXG79992.1 DUF397 domain-containing protein [Streptomyces paludis]
MTTLDLHGAAWRKSSYSGSGGDCVEVADLASTTSAAVRDSKTPHGAALTSPVGSWSSFVTSLKRGNFPI